VKDIYTQPYKPSNVEHLYQKFDYFADIDYMECNKTSEICSFNIPVDAHSNTILITLFIVFFVIYKLIGIHGDGSNAGGTY